MAQYFAEENVSSDSETIMVFSGAQTAKFEDEEDPELICDTGSMISLVTDLKKFKSHQEI